jgi:hypothetical protein
MEQHEHQERKILVQQGEILNDLMMAFSTFAKNHLGNANKILSDDEKKDCHLLIKKGLTKITFTNTERQQYYDQLQQNLRHIQDLIHNNTPIPEIVLDLFYTLNG